MTSGGEQANGKLAAVARRNPLPKGTLAVGVGLLLSGVTSYVFLSLSSRALGAEAYAPLGLLWTAMFLLGPGLFLPVEQEVSRALAERAAQQEGGAPVIRKAGLLAAGLLGAVLLGIALASPALLDKLFDDQILLLLGLAIGMVGTAAGHLARGACSGQNRFRAYAVFLGADGVLRVAMCGALVAAGVDEAGPYGVAVGLAPVLAVPIALWGEKELLKPGREATWKEVSGALATLLVGSILSFTLINGSPLAIKYFGTEAEEADAGRFLNGLIIARVPLFLFQAVQASLLPRLSSLAGAGRIAEFRNGMWNLMMVTVAIGGIASIGAFAVGPQVVLLMFGEEFELDHRTLGLLALGCALYMIASALGQAVIALSGHRWVALSWAIGVVAFVVTAAVAADDLFLRVELGLLAGSGAAVLAMALALIARLGSGEQPLPGAVIEALHEIPMEP
jgi:O-antigen/teichoic acid export membrane protein